MTDSTDEGCDDDMCTQDEVAHKSLGWGRSNETVSWLQSQGDA